MSERNPLTPRARRDLVEAIGLGKVTRLPKSGGDWRKVSNSFGRAKVSKAHIDLLEAEGVARLGEDDVWRLTEVGRAEWEKGEPVQPAAIGGDDARR